MWIQKIFCFHKKKVGKAIVVLLLGEPFDFLTWFEFAPEHTDVFDELLVKLRASEEWKYVEREVDIRLIKDPAWKHDVQYLSQPAWVVEKS